MDAPLIAVVGPTGAGKSALALRLCRERSGEIVSCDSLQGYRGFDIGSAKATAVERHEVPHHMLDVVDPDQSFSAAMYASRARAVLRDVAARGRLAVVAGGTGLYLRALLQGLFEGPSRVEPLRRRFEHLADCYGDARLHQLLRRVDPQAALRISPRDRVRVIRALEVFWSTGRPLSTLHREGSEPLQGFRILIVGLDPGREALRALIEERTRQMLDAGLLDEVRGLLERFPPDIRPLSAIGYRQAVAVVQGRMSVRGLERDIVSATLRFAKRQKTWFRHQVEAEWHRDGEAARGAVAAWLDRPPPSA